MDIIREWRQWREWREKEGRVSPELTADG